MFKLYTIGYSCFKIDKFIDTLKGYKITCLVDVRSVPLSVYYPEYNKQNLSRLLPRNKILYRHYAKEFGARQLDRQFYTDGVLDFEKFSESTLFLEGVKKIEKGMELGYTFVMMCAEKRPEDCHRCILVARKFHELGYNVRHILNDGTYITHGEVEEILVDKYLPDHDQISLFGGLSEEELIKQSYRKCNMAIGYRIEEERNENLYNRIY